MSFSSKYDDNGLSHSLGDSNKSNDLDENESTKKVITLGCLCFPPALISIEQIKDSGIKHMQVSQ